MNATDVTPDVLVRDEGTVFVFCPLTAAAKEWIDENVQPDALWFENALIVEHRFSWGGAGDGRCGTCCAGVKTESGRRGKLYGERREVDGTFAARPHRKRRRNCSCRWPHSSGGWLQTRRRRQRRRPWRRSPRARPPQMRNLENFAKSPDWMKGAANEPRTTVEILARAGAGRL